MNDAEQNSLSAEQSEVIAFLGQAQAYGEPDLTVERIETHVSVVFLAGVRAFKLKKAVAFPYLDFSTLELRKAAAEAELRLNRRTAPDIYKAVTPVTRNADGALALGGSGVPVEWLVEMARFDSEATLDRISAGWGADNRSSEVRFVLEDLAAAIAAFHEKAEVRRDKGGYEGFKAVLLSNDASFRQFAGDVFSIDEINQLTERQFAHLDYLHDLLDKRNEDGRFRHCHGDLHLRNICMVDGVPTLFDAIEFNDDFACVDVLYDFAFLLMDLDFSGLRWAGNVLFNRYMEITGDTGGLVTLPLLMSVRAAVRALVGAAAVAGKPNTPDRLHDAQTARAYFERALRYLERPAPCLVAVGGLSGSGKSRLGRDIAHHIGGAPGALILRTDGIRKRLMGVDILTRLGADGYSAEITEKTYSTLYQSVENGLKSGFSVIADGVFAQPDQRAALESIAAKADVPFAGLWADAPPQVRKQRVVDRKKNISDATAKVLDRQLTYDLGTVSWNLISTTQSKSATLDHAIDVVRHICGGALVRED